MLRNRAIFVGITLTCLPALLPAQSNIGTVEAAAASVSGSLTINRGEMLIGSNAVITARDRTATVQLTRGGEVLVCTTSALHAARGGGSAGPEPLLLALDRGAIEVHMAAGTSDAILTPDLRFSLAPPASGGPIAGLLDLRIRVAPNGDTCVENRGANAPTLEVAEQFGTGIYRVQPEQHLLFEHGSLREVVDHETSPCGCPPPPVLSAAESGISTDVTRAARPGARVADDPAEVQPHTAAERQYPFPAAESQGLTRSTPATNVPQAPAGQPHAQVAATLAFGGDGKNSDGTSNAPPSSAPAGGTPPPSPASATAQPPASSLASAPEHGIPLDASAFGSPAASPGPPAPVTDPIASHEVAQAPLPPAAPPPRDLAHKVGHFFRHLFHPSDATPLSRR